jgi:hypothetical protein
MLEQITRARLAVSASRARLAAAMRGEDGVELITVIIGIVIGVIVLGGIFLAISALGTTANDQVGNVDSTLSGDTSWN